VEITSNPIETGAEVNDHAYIKPKQVVLEVADRNAAELYNALVRFQESRVPFYLVTGLTVYEDMLIQAIDADRDKIHSTILKATVTCKQVIIVSTGSAPSESEGQSSGKDAGKPGGKNSKKAATPTKQGANNSSTADRAASTVQTGDNPTKAVAPEKTKSLAKRIFG
ncbi:phage baseplate protein, partial [Streptomyces sp. P17]|uniref:phage baseplate protein n=1 Tax=Streptomyces sp. P17 TaxID=3074716 RepID=UPI0028F45106